VHVERIGSGPPEVAVVGGIHGDEPAGARAVEYLHSADLELTGSVTLVTANERALERGVRYVEEDLNRAFPPRGTTPTEFEWGDTHEGRLAERLYDLLRDKLTLAVHSTQSHPEPFAVVVDPDTRRLETCAALPVESVVDSSALTDGRLLEAVPAIEIEAGHQGSVPAARNAERISRAFLAATGAVAEPVERTQKPLFRLDRPIPKPAADSYEVLVENFQEVPAGEPFATVAGRSQRAESAFVPVLVSAYGYEDLFGYAATKVGSVTADGVVDYD
jgi:predicted deacylase